MRAAVLYALTIGFASGIFFRSLFDIASGSAAIAAGSLCLFALALRVRTGRWSRVGVVLIFVALAGALGVVRYDVAVRHERTALAEMHLGEEVVIEGVVDREVDARARTAQLSVRVEALNGESVDTRVLVVTERFPEFFYGDRVRVRGSLERPEAFETDLGRTFNYPGYLAARGIRYVMPFAGVERVGAAEGNAVLSTLLATKGAFMRALESVLPEPYAGLGEGLLLGVKRALGADLEEVFRVTGIIHIVVLSGYNVTIVAEAIMRVLARFFRVRTRVIFGIAAIAAFALTAGLSATVLRASLMAVLVLAARATGRIYDVMRALMLAGTAMLLVNPMLLVFDPGFQLSFLATVGLIVLAPLIEAHLSWVPTRLQIREFLTATIATQLFVLPLLLYSIGQFSLVSVVVNVLVLPAVPAAMLMTFLTGVIGLASTTLALPVGFGAYLFLRYIIEVAEWFAGIPYAAFVVPAFPFWVVIVAYALFALVIIFLQRGIFIGSAARGGSDAHAVG